MESVNVNRDKFFLDGLSKGVAFGQLEKEWKASPFSIKRGKSLKGSFTAYLIAGEITRENLAEKISELGSANDTIQISYYKGRMSDHEASYRAGYEAGLKAKKQA